MNGNGRVKQSDLPDSLKSELAKGTSIELNLGVKFEEIVVNVDLFGDSPGTDIVDHVQGQSIEVQTALLTLHP